MPQILSYNFFKIVSLSLISAQKHIESLNQGTNQGTQIILSPYKYFYKNNLHYSLSIDNTIDTKKGHKTGTEHQKYFWSVKKKRDNKE